MTWCGEVGIISGRYHSTDTIEDGQSKSRTVVELFGRCKNGQSICLLIDGLSPSFEVASLGAWNEGEEFIDQINLDWVNDAYDDGEYWIDSNNDGIRNEGEEFFDGYNGIYDEGEFFTDLVGNGYWEDGEQFIDKKNDEFRIYGKLFTLGMEFDLSENDIIDLMRSSLYRFYSESSLQRFNKCNKISFNRCSSKS